MGRLRTCTVEEHKDSYYEARVEEVYDNGNLLKTLIDQHLTPTLMVVGLCRTRTKTEGKPEACKAHSHDKWGIQSMHSLHQNVPELLYRSIRGLHV